MSSTLPSLVTVLDIHNYYPNFISTFAKFEQRPSLNQLNSWSPALHPASGMAVKDLVPYIGPINRVYEVQHRLQSGP